jgi:phosphate starvation-inducible PhoH-like protein
MPARRNRKANNPIGVGLTAKQMRRKKPINTDSLNKIEAITDNQQLLFDQYDKGQNIIAYGSAGTGKTFVTLYKALQEVLNEHSPYERVYLVRSVVATREIGFLPGDHDDKSALYQIPYKNMVKYMFLMETDADFDMLYGNLMAQETLKFWSTSFLRGTTLDKAIIIVDEFQNLNAHELDSIMTRVGEDSKIHFCGDASQSDLVKASERSGIMDFLSILERMPSVSKIEFGLDDIVRSGLCKEYLVAKHESGIEI